MAKRVIHFLKKIVEGDSLRNEIANLQKMLDEVDSKVQT